MNTLYPEDETEIKTKICVYCKEKKTTSEFQNHPGYKDKLDIRCNCCIKSRKKIVENLRKNAPPKPENCQCCDKTGVTLVLDHCSINNTFRGWICGNCNKGLGMLGDTKDGLLKALKYLSENKNA
jgi:hypothetical protein